MLGSKDELERLTSDLVTWLRQQADAAGARGAVFGLSGGVDSAVVGALCSKAFGNECLAVIMPCHSAGVDTVDAQLVASTFNLPTRIVDLTGVFDTLLLAIKEADGASGTAIAVARPNLSQANIKPRLRMTTLYYYANARNYLVVGSENRSELEIGYFTKYGDGGADVLPLGRLLKTEVYALAEHLGVPERIIRRTPSAGLWPGQTDEAELGLTYEVLDRYLATGAGPAEAVERIDKLRAQSEHKRRMPPLGPGRNGHL